MLINKCKECGGQMDWDGNFLYMECDDCNRKAINAKKQRF